MMYMWVVYDYPNDFPENVVIRKWTLDDYGSCYPATLPEYVAKTLEAAQQYMLQTHPTLTRLNRFQEDDPCIVEVWL